MKNIKVVFAALFLATLAGCATNADLEKINIQIKTLEERIAAIDNRAAEVEKRQVDQTRLDFSRFCFSNNMAFSEGSIYAGKICERQGIMVYQEGRQIPQPLVWRPWKYQ